MHGTTIYTFTHDTLRLQHVSCSFRSSSVTLHQTSIYQTQTNYQRGYKFGP
jgi:hypothetical protein